MRGQRVHGGHHSHARSRSRSIYSSNEAGPGIASAPADLTRNVNARTFANPCPADTIAAAGWLQRQTTSSTAISAQALRSCEPVASVGESVRQRMSSRFGGLHRLLQRPTKTGRRSCLHSRQHPLDLREHDSQILTGPARPGPQVQPSVRRLSVVRRWFRAWMISAIPP